MRSSFSVGSMCGQSAPAPKSVSQSMRSTRCSMARSFYVKPRRRAHAATRASYTNPKRDRTLPDPGRDHDRQGLARCHRRAAQTGHPVTRRLADPVSAAWRSASAVPAAGRARLTPPAMAHRSDFRAAARWRPRPAAMAGSGRTMLGFPLLVPLRKSRRGTRGRDGVRSPKPAWRRW